jgi:hypothetical protein
MMFMYRGIAARQNNSMVGLPEMFVGWMFSQNKGNINDVIIS